MVNKLEQHLLDQDNTYEKGKNFFWHKLRSRYVIELIKKYKSIDELNILDVGAGAGIFNEHLKNTQLSWRYNFVEPFVSLASRLEERVGGSANRNTSENYHDMDFLILMDVLEHQEYDLDFLINLKSKMKKGTYLIITCPAMMYLWSDWDKALGHYRRYSITSFNDVIKKSGFEIMESHYLFPMMTLPGLLRKNKKFKDDAEFPEIPSVINTLIYYGGIVEQKVSPFVPFGSSVVAVVRA